MHNGQVPMIQSNVSKRGNFCDCFGYFTICCQSPELTTPLTENLLFFFFMKQWVLTHSSD